MIEPEKKRLFTFFDCQNLFKSAQAAWGYSYPNFDPIKLSLLIPKLLPDCLLRKIYIYTGIHHPKKDYNWYYFWDRKLKVASQDPRVTTVTRELRYTFTNGIPIPREKGIDVKISLDLIRLARENMYDTAVIFSQDNDFAEVAMELREVSKTNDRWIKIASAFPIHNNGSKERGIKGTDWIKITKENYDSCIDNNDYRPQEEVSSVTQSEPVQV